MATLKDLVVLGPSNFVLTTYMSEVYSDKFVTNTGTSLNYVKGDGTLGNTSEFASSSSLSNYLPLAGGTMTGPIKRYLGTSNSAFTYLTVNEQDVWIWHARYGTSVSDSVSPNYGFGLKYMGTGSGDNNSLILFSDSTTGVSGEPVKSVEIKQSGSVYTYCPVNLYGNSSSIYFGTGKTDTSFGILQFNSSNLNYGIWYHNLTNDKMTFSVSGNANNIDTSDFAIVRDTSTSAYIAVRGNIVCHKGNVSSFVGTNSTYGMFKLSSAQKTSAITTISSGTTYYAITADKDGKLVAAIPTIPTDKYVERFSATSTSSGVKVSYYYNGSSTENTFTIPIANTTYGVVKAEATTESSGVYFVRRNSEGKLTYSITNANHYTPSTHGSSEISATAGTNKAISKITLSRDSKGHVTAISKEEIDVITSGTYIQYTSTDSPNIQRIRVVSTPGTQSNTLYIVL